jgi:hypothetical protein
MKQMVSRSYEVTTFEALPLDILLAAAQTVFEAETGIGVGCSVAAACDHTVSVIGWTR